jgi:hypothetical protein
MTATFYVGWSSAVLMPVLNDLARTRRRTSVPPRLRPDRRLLRKNSLATSCSPCDVLLARAAQIDAGFDINVLADMIATLDRFADDDIPVTDASFVAELRAFYAAWRSELAA